MGRGGAEMQYGLHRTAAGRPGQLFLSRRVPVQGFMRFAALVYLHNIAVYYQAKWGRKRPRGRRNERAVGGRCCHPQPSQGGRQRPIFADPSRVQLTEAGRAEAITCAPP